MYANDSSWASRGLLPEQAEMQTLDHGQRSNDSVFGDLTGPAPLDELAIEAPRVVEHDLPFRVSVVTTDAQLLRVQALRQLAYGRHLPAQAASFGHADPLDRMDDTTIFLVEDKETGETVGSARVQSNRRVPLQIERSIELPPSRRGQLLAEITRLCVQPGYVPPVRLALMKASHLFCIAMQLSGVVAGSRRSMLRTYENLGFVDLYGDNRLCPLHHAGGLPHRVLYRDAVLSEALTREANHPDYDFVFRHYHPDIDIFGAVATAVSRGLRPRRQAAWARAA